MQRPSSTFFDLLKEDRDLLEHVDPASETCLMQTIRWLAAWMQWVLVIDESLGKLNSSYGTKRDADGGGRAIHGLRYAWERLKHQGHRLDDLVLASMSADRSIVTAATNPPRSRVVPAATLEVHWKELDALPSPDLNWTEKGPVKPKEAAYKQYLSGRPVIESTSSIQVFLLSL